MKPQPKLAPALRGTRFGSLLVLGILAPIAGAGAGLLGALFRLALAAADRFRDALIAAAHGHRLLGFLLVVGASAAAVACAAWLVRQFSPDASGSGIPHVEAALSGAVPHAPPSLIPVKFVGGTLAIGAGLALGREGPSVQMGAAISHLLGVVCRLQWPDCRVLLAAGAGAGLATAFNAPIAGAVFVLEELVRRFEAHIAIAALGASAAAIAVARALLGPAPDFAVAPLAYPAVQIWPLFVALGAVAGFLAVLYNAALLGGLAVADRLGGWPAELRGAVIGASVGALGWFLPDLVGGGDAITQHTLTGSAMLAMLPLAFLLRFALGAVSYAAATPGGLFAPLLVLGAQLGLFFGVVCQLALPGAGLDPTAFAVVGMAAFFTGMVQAPVTGIVLVIEMTASVPMLLPMIAACFAAMLVPNLLGAPPIYDALRERTAQITRAADVRGESSR
ncbi:MAG: H(+)/Cl(-) exchange transporter ClcA [Alphaproteobacteria bacterium]|nr:H(+)/Cl(-) exchange transporter ClcA [Alphaproteobacteria bacterium]